MALAVLDSVLGRYVKQLHESMNPSMENNNVLKLTLCVALSSQLIWTVSVHIIDSLGNCHSFMETFHFLSNGYLTYRTSEVDENLELDK